jgi:hypothetical protein
MKVRDTGSGDFQQVEAGTYAAICYRVLDLGTQTSTFEGKQSSDAAARDSEGAAEDAAERRADELRERGWDKDR